jgi:hypothetical protein
MWKYRLNEIASLRAQLDQSQRRSHRQAAPFSRVRRQAQPKRPGYEPGQGRFSFRPAPEAHLATRPPGRSPHAGDLSLRWSAVGADTNRVALNHRHRTPTQTNRAVLPHPRLSVQFLWEDGSSQVEQRGQPALAQRIASAPREWGLGAVLERFVDPADEQCGGSGVGPGGDRAENLAVLQDRGWRRGVRRAIQLDVIGNKAFGRFFPQFSGRNPYSG